METKQVGPFVVTALNVDQGLNILRLLTSDTSEFQKQLLLQTVSLNGQPVAGESMATVIPHMGELIKVAMELNGLGDGE